MAAPHRPERGGMTLRDDLVLKLEQENEELRARVRMLEELTGANFDAPPQFGFTRNEVIIFGLLLKNKLVLRSSMMGALYFHKQDEAEIKIVDVWVCKMRRKLKPYGIVIETQWGQGYFIPAESKAIAQSLLDQARAA
jgi:two-component system cell cycle response regulator CtrA